MLKLMGKKIFTILRSEITFIKPMQVVVDSMFYVSFIGGSYLVLSFEAHNFVSFLILQSSRWGKESWLLYFKILST